MLGQFVTGGRSSSPSNNRIFVYEVTGLKQNEQSDSNSYPVRTSSSVFMQVPYNRMNEEMLRITRMGGTIIKIKPFGASDQDNSQPANKSKAKSEQN